MDRLPADVYLAPDRVLDSAVVGVQIDQIVRAALGNQADVAVDGLAMCSALGIGRNATVAHPAPPPTLRRW
jgi:hypothetical protein